ncbi:AIR synthase family protein [Thermococcus sp.]|uniref:AIR synthase family protein n=1 Tax=Thermococcus sp. TaxID=35749 RepID=UPI00262F55FC|nr:AIR synthase family protein [Thermococcus sp.]
MAGKVPPEVLERILSKIRSNDPRVLIGPGIGIDVSAVSFGERTLVASTDPITGAVEDIGYYAVHINANDVATSGARPRWFLVTLLLPEGEERLAGKIMGQIASEAGKLGVSVIGGHTELTPGLSRPIVVGTMLGEVDGRPLSSAGARPGDAIVMTKWAGLEGTSIIARERREELATAFGRSFVERAESLAEYLSVVDEALYAAAFGANAMHDPTEGGVANGVHEMADAAGLGFRLYTEGIPIREETEKICSFYGLNPLALMGSGSLLIAVPRDAARLLVERLLARGIKATLVGEFLAEKKRVAIRNGDELPFKRPKADELWKLFKA